MEGILSQEEIDALLGGGSEEEEVTEPSTQGFGKTISLTKEEEDAIGEVGNISLGSSSTALSTLLGKNVSITTPKVMVHNFEDLKQSMGATEKVLVQIEYKTGFDGLNILMIDKKDAIIIGDLMMGNDGTTPPDDLDELYLSAVGESMNQMMGSSATSLAGMFSKEVDINPPDIAVTNLDVVAEKTDFFMQNPEFITVVFDMEIEGLVSTNIYQIISSDFVKRITKEMYDMGGGSQEPEVTASTPEPQMQYQEPQMQQPDMAAMGQQQPNMGYGQPQMMQQPNMGYGQPQMMQQPNMGYGQPQMMQQPNMGYGQPQMMGGYGGMNQPVNVQPVQFASFGSPSVNANLPSNIDMIMDVPLHVTVELGRTKMQIKEILDLGAGSIVELDKLAGEPVDVLVNGKLIAKGEVVVIDESFGVRITDIVSQMERLTKVQ